MSAEAPADEASRPPARRARRTRIAAIAALVVVLVVAAAGIGGFAILQLRGGALGAPTFADETASAGIEHTYAGDATYDTGGGVAVFDCSGDGKPEIYMAGGTNPAVLYRNDSPVGGALRFTAVHDPATDLTGVVGAYPIDIDGDGRTDLVVLRAGEDVILRGLGDCRFQRANEALGFDGGAALSTAFSATWEGANALPTLAVGHFRHLDPDGSLTLDCESPVLYRPDASGSRYAAPVPLQPGYCPLSLLFSDWSGTGERDLRVANDRNYYIGGQEQLWRFVPGEDPRLWTEAEGWVPVQIQGMGIATSVLPGSDFPYYYVTSQADSKLFELKGGPDRPTYRSVARQRGVTAARPGAGTDVLPSTSWHPEFVDVNNDGFLDLLVTKGNPSAVPEYASKDPSSLFLGQQDGVFVDVAEKAGIVDYDRGRGAAVADFNLDGLPDLVEMFYEAPARLWRNVGTGTAAAPAPMGHWLDVRVSQPSPNADAVGSWVEVKAGETVMRRELNVGGGHASGERGWIHFGLGSADRPEVRIVWPDGTTGPWLPVAADSFVEVAKGATAATPWEPAAP